MSKLSLYYPAKPYRLNQAWGIKNPAYEQFGFSEHNGIDIALGDDKRLYAPCNGTVVRIGNQPQGGGIFFGIMTDYYDWNDGKYRVLIDFLHCEQLLVHEGQVLQTGDLMAIADNTGFSTGPHTHIQPRRVKWWNGLFGDAISWETLDVNEANNSFDPIPYFNGFAAKDYALVSTLQKLIALYKQLAGIH